MTYREYLENLRIPTKDNPLRILMSACLSGITCGWDGTANGEYPAALKILKYDTVKVVKFCPEEFSYGTPREMSDIHGGTGFDVLEGKAKVLSESGKDWTEGMIKASERMLEIAQQENIELAVLMDISAACGSQVIYNGNRFSENKSYQIGAGVAAALLIRNGFKVISQRDYASLEILYSKLDPAHQLDKTKLDHHEIAWYKEYFKIT
ncbi:DUF523 domain-containing protein [Ignavibacteria bacterium CHB1]|nr:MAG: DUF523 domain-containing protein [Chlorobiota bacterium]MBV6397960.1 hypothetical protein [Ignavibacteria bacterium]MCE7952519.1 DUF523 domain-containing protein [Chlorobi bacterium CHB7]MDL1886633.1 DUF523 domain-containing protein [Ignavibacteria bacterium CHB1]